MDAANTRRPRVVWPSADDPRLHMGRAGSMPPAGANPGRATAVIGLGHDARR